MPAKYVHMMFPEKFMRDYIEFIHDEFNASEHEFYFVHMEDHKKFPDSIPPFDNVIKVKSIRSWLRLIKALYQSKSVVFHSLNKPFMIGLASLPFIASKTHWVGWGADIHFHKTHRGSLKYELHECLRRFTLKRIHAFHNGQISDYESIRDVYKFDGKFFFNFAYPTNTKWEKKVKPLKKDNRKDGLHVVVGHSGAKEIEHVKAFKMIKSAVEGGEITKVYCPLSYGQADHIQYVKEQGEALLGDAFEPMFNFMTYDDYVEWMRESVDVIIIGGKSSNAHGNMILANALGKTLVLEDDAPYRIGLEGKGIRVKSFSDFEKNPTVHSFDVRQQNLENLYKHYSRKFLIDRWSEVFKRG